VVAAVALTGDPTSDADSAAVAATVAAAAKPPAMRAARFLLRLTARVVCEGVGEAGFWLEVWVGTEVVGIAGCKMGDLSSVGQSHVG